jgi:hypothetical protein
MGGARRLDIETIQMLEDEFQKATGQRLPAKELSDLFKEQVFRAPGGRLQITPGGLPGTDMERAQMIDALTRRVAGVGGNVISPMGEKITRAFDKSAQAVQDHAEAVKEATEKLRGGKPGAVVPAAIPGGGPQPIPRPGG